MNELLIELFEKLEQPYNSLVVLKLADMIDTMIEDGVLDESDAQIAENIEFICKLPKK